MIYCAPATEAGQMVGEIQHREESSLIQSFELSEVKWITYSRITGRWANYAAKSPVNTDRGGGQPLINKSRLCHSTHDHSSNSIMWKKYFDPLHWRGGTKNSFPKLMQTCSSWHLCAVWNVFLIDDDPVKLSETESLQSRVMTLHSIFDDEEKQRGFQSLTAK